jgi:predicted enzyme related to lactoylglutathione lyase
MAETHTPDAVNIAGSGRNPVGWFEIYVADMQRAKDFYGDVVQATFTESSMSGGDMEMWFFAGDPMAAGASGGLIRHDMRQPGMEGTLVYFSVDDCAAAIARATARGSTVLVDRLSIGEMGFAGIVTDTEGNSIGLHSMV